MSENKLQPREALNKAYLKVKPDRESVAEFKTNLARLIDLCDRQKDEEYNKNLLIDFLKKSYYSDRYFINTKDRSDLVIHNGDKSESAVGVIFETKKPTKTNSVEMPTVDNCKFKYSMGFSESNCWENVWWNICDANALYFSNPYYSCDQTKIESDRESCAEMYHC